MGKAVVASPQALAGLRARPGVQALAASTPHEWAEAVSRLLEDGALRRQLGAAGRRYVEEHHRWEACLEPFAPLLGLPAGEGPTGDPPPRAASAAPRVLAPPRGDPA
jgi:polysaccharide biosynthesis protein PslH